MVLCLDSIFVKMYIIPISNLNGKFSQMCQLHSTVTEAGNNAIGCRVVQQFTGGHKCKLLSRSSLFVKPNNRDSGTLLAAYGDEATHSVSKKNMTALLYFSDYSHLMIYKILERHKIF